MKRKLRQNRFYGDNVKTLVVELDQLDAFLSTVETESLQFNLHEMRNLLTAQIKSQMGIWRHQLNEIQSLISQRLFVRRQIEADLRLLFDAGLWLENNPTRNGLEVELGQTAPPVLLSPMPIKVRSHYDIRAKATDQERILCSVANRLPLNRTPGPAKEPRVKQVVLSAEPEVADVEFSPEDLLIQELIDKLKTSERPFEILQWQREKRLAAGIGDEEWLLYASSQLAISGVQTELQIFRDRDTFNAVFDDVMVFPG